MVTKISKKIDEQFIKIDKTMIRNVQRGKLLKPFWFISFFISGPQKLALYG